jgi:hypothetical protein
VSFAIAADHAGRPGAELDARWILQVEALPLPAVNGTEWIDYWLAHERLDRREAIVTMADALGNMTRLPKLETLIPPPGTRASRVASTPTASADPILERIRALLAKAESTTFEAEAIAFTAKAQELMTRHAIDAALLAGQTHSDGQGPSAIRVPVDNPYVNVKSLLLQTVAEAGRCRSLIHGRLGLSTVVGLPEDLVAVEMLFTSLLVQAQTALAGAGARSKSYRSTFLLAFTDRIGERLREINDAVYAEAEAEHGGSFLPVLRSQADAIDDFITERFGKVKTTPVRGGHDPAAWAGGRYAADNAKLAFGDLAS